MILLDVWLIFLLFFCKIFNFKIVKVKFVWFVFDVIKFGIKVKFINVFCGFVYNCLNGFGI